jgi:hypothetical protein
VFGQIPLGEEHVSLGDFSRLESQVDFLDELSFSFVHVFFAPVNVGVSRFCPRRRDPNVKTVAQFSPPLQFPFAPGHSLWYDILEIWSSLVDQKFRSTANT